MSRKVLIQHYVDGNGVEFGRVVKPSEMMSIQDYAHNHIEQITRDLIMRNAASSVVAGFGLTLTGGMNLSVAAGTVVDAQGRSFDTFPAGNPSVLAVSAAHASQPRIDLVYASVSVDQDSENQLLPHRRLRTSLELSEGTPEYLPTNVNVPTERQNRATVSIRQGVAGANPIAPAAGANEVALFHIRVEANAVAITNDKVTDVRTAARSLSEAWTEIDTLNSHPVIANFAEAVDDRFAALFAVTPNTGLSGVYNDAGNSYALAGTAATQQAMGMMSAEDKTKLDAATDANVANAIVRRDVVGNFSAAAVTAANGVRGATNNQMGGAAGFRGTTLTVEEPATHLSQTPMTSMYGGISVLGNPCILGVFGVAQQIGGGSSKGLLHVEDTNPQGNYPLHNLLTLYGGSGNATGNPPGQQIVAFKVSSNGNATVGGSLSVLGSISKGSGTFQIDHPLDPLNKDLVHGFVESNRYALIYWFDVVVVDGSGMVDLDTVLGFTQGTAQALMQNLKVVSLRVTNGTTPTLSVDILPDEVNNVISIEVNGQSGVNVTATVLLVAERKDPYIMQDQFVDGQGRLVAEHLKPALSQEELGELDPATEAVPEGDVRAGTTQNRIVPGLIGKQGYPRHPQVVAGGASYPTRPVTYQEEGA